MPTGPARFQDGDHRLRHWFNGLAMPHAFSFAGGRVMYADRFLRPTACGRRPPGGALPLAVHRPHRLLGRRRPARPGPGARPGGPGSRLKALGGVKRAVVVAP
ncbi:carotenoid oxygenase family protein [Streptomyces phaeoluteigriseus]